MLKANKQLVSVSRIVSSPHLVMAIGRQEQVSAERSGDFVL